MCKLCDLVKQNPVKTRVYWENDDLIMVDCDVENVPMVIAKQHIPEIDDADKDAMVHLFYNHADRGADMKNWAVDFNMETKDHWNCYLRKRD
jgi:hypothetical protein